MSFEISDPNHLIGYQPQEARGAAIELTETMENVVGSFIKTTLDILHGKPVRMDLRQADAHSLGDGAVHDELYDRLSNGFGFDLDRMLDMTETGVKITLAESDKEAFAIEAPEVTGRQREVSFGFVPTKSSVTIRELEFVRPVTFDHPEGKTLRIVSVQPYPVDTAAASGESQ